MDPSDGHLTDQVTDRMTAAGAGLPSGGDAWAKAMDQLAEELLTSEGLTAAILVRRRALDLLGPRSHSAECTRLRHNLAVDIVARYRQGGQLKDLTEACALGRRVLADATPADRLHAAASLAGRLSQLARYPGHEPELDEAIRILSAEIRRAAKDDPAHPQAVAHLAGLELHRWQRDGDLAALVTAVSDLEIDKIDGATPVVANVAGLLLEYGEQTHDLASLQQAEVLLREAVESDNQTAAVLGTLANALIARYDFEGDEGRLTEAIRLDDAAVDASSPGPDRAEYFASRARARAALAGLRGDQDLLDAAVGDARRAADEPTVPGTDASGPISSLAMLLAERYEMRGDSTDLDQAIALYERQLARPDVAADARPALLINLANVLLTRYERDHANADLRRAANLADEAIAATPPGGVHLAARHHAAGQIRAAMADHLGSEHDAERAQEHGRAAIDSTPEGSPDRSLYLNSLAMWVTGRWERTGDPAVLATAIQLLEQALAEASGEGQLIGTIRFNLAVRIRDKFELELERGQADWNELQRACDLLDEALAAELPYISLPAARELGNIAVSLSAWSQGEHALRLALAAAGELAGARPLRPDKQRARSGVQGIGSLAALCAVRAGDVPAAAVHLEQASATVIAESLGVRGDTVRFADITRACSAMRRSVLFLGSSYAGGLAVLAREDGSCQAIELADLTEDRVLAATTGFRKALAAALANDASDSLDACYAAGGQFLDWTWSAVLAPLSDLLAGTGRLAVLPLGRLAWLPLSAAGPRGATPALARHEPVLLIRATAGHLAGNRVAAAAAAQHARAHVPAGRRVLVWADTGPVDRSIPGVLEEARQVAAIYPVTRLVLNDRQAGGVAASTVPVRGTGSPRPGRPALTPAPPTPEAVALLRSADIVHLACHCDVDPEHPEDTVLQVEPPVRIGDLGADGVSTGAHVVLSACDAALTANSLPDEAFSPATALLVAGAATVTAPVWPVDDDATAEFMTSYHRELASGGEPGRALSRLQASWSSRWPAFLYAPWIVVVRPPGQPG